MQQLDTDLKEEVKQLRKWAAKALDWMDTGTHVPKAVHTRMTRELSEIPDREKK